MSKMNQMIKPVMLACSAGLLLTACATDRDEYSYSTTQDSYATGNIREGSGAQSGWQAGSDTRSAQQSQQYTTQQRQSSGQSYSSGQTQQSGNEVIIPLHEEQLNVGKRTVDAGTVTIRKIVTTETVNQPIELRKETLVIDREGGARVQTSSSQFQSSTSSQRQSAGVNAQASGAGIQAQAEFDESEPAGATARSTTAQQNWNQSSQQNLSSGTSGNAFQEQTYTIQLREEQPVVEKNVIQTGRVVARKNSETQRQNVQREIRREDVRLDQGANSRNVQLRGDFNTSGTLNEPSGAARQSESQDQSQSDQTETEIQTQSSEVEAEADAVLKDDAFEDRNTLDDINRGSNTRGGAEDLQRFDERSTPRE